MKTEEEEKVYRHVESVSLSDLLVEADVILQSSSASSSSSMMLTSTTNSKMSSPKRFGGNKVVSVTNDDDNSNAKTLLFPRALMKRLKPAFASFCRRFHHHGQDHTGDDDSRMMFTMNSKAWLSVLTESNLLSKTFSASRAIGCFENVVSRRFRESNVEREKKNNGDDDEEEYGNEERRITFEEFATLLGEAVAKAYDVEAKAVGKRVVATAYAMERKREEEERRRDAFVSDAVIVVGGGDNDDDDDDDDDDDYYEYELRYGVGNIGNNNANNISRRPRTMATMQPVATSSKSVTNNNPGMLVSPSSPSSSSSSWRIRAERYTNRYNRSSLDGDYLASSSSLAATNSARGRRYRYDETDEEDILFEDRVANAFETVFCQSLATTTTGPSSSSSAFRLGGGDGAGGGERRKRKTIDEREFVKICTACALIGNGFTASDCLDVAFAVGAAEKNGEITTRAFLRALRKIASAHDVSFADVARRVVAVSKALLRER